MSWCGRDDLIAVKYPFEQIAQAVGILWAHDHVNLWHAAKQRLALLLSDAPGDDDGEVLSSLFALGMRAEVGIYLGLGVLADGASATSSSSRHVIMVG